MSCGHALAFAFPEDRVSRPIARWCGHSAMHSTVHDIRTYYEELACELADTPIGPWATEEWFYDQTKAGQTILEARRAMRNAKVDNSLWFGLATAGRE